MSAARDTRGKAHYSKRKNNGKAGFVNNRRFLSRSYAGGEASKAVRRQKRRG